MTSVTTSRDKLYSMFSWYDVMQGEVITLTASMCVDRWVLTVA